MNAACPATVFQHPQHALNLFFPGVLSAKKKAANSFIFQLIKQCALGGTAVAARASRFLIVAFNGVWKVPVNDKTHIGLVDPQSEGVGCNNQRAFPTHEGVLCPLTRAHCELPVISHASMAEACQPLMQLVDFPHGGCIYDNASGCFLHDTKQPGTLLIAIDCAVDFETEIVAIDGLLDHACIGDTERV